VVGSYGTHQIHSSNVSTLKYLELIVHMERANRNQPDSIELLEFLPGTIQFIRFIAEVLLKLEVRLVVLRAPGKYDRSSRTLMSARYTAPLPHSSRP
jgi:Ni/Fe-hydrogenase subunit HybB-like protein